MIQPCQTVRPAVASDLWGQEISECAQCGAPVARLESLTIVETVEAERPCSAQEVVAVNDELARLGLPRGVAALGSRLVHVVGLCSTCAALLPHGSD